MTNFNLNANTTIPVTGFGVFMVPNNGPTEEAVTTALKEGYRLIDTAAAYQNESDVGKAVKKSGIPRKEIYVTSKLWLQDYGYEAAKKAIDTSLDRSVHAPAKIIFTLEQRLYPAKVQDLM